MIGPGGLLTAMTGHRRPTARFCPACGQWVDTARGLQPDQGHAPRCRKRPAWTALGVPLATLRVLSEMLWKDKERPDPAPRAPAFIPAHRLGSKRRATGVPLRMGGA